MKTAAATVRQAHSLPAPPAPWHQFAHDLARDWRAWSIGERLAVRALAISSLLLGAFYLGLNVIAAG